MKDKTWTLELAEDEELKILERMKNCGITNTEEFLNSSLSLFLRVIEELQQGKKLALIDPENDSYCEIHMDIFDQIKQ
jgi:hypothetical protein